MTGKKLLKKKTPQKTAQPKDVAYPVLENMLATMYRLQQEGLDNRTRFLEMEAAVLKYMKDMGIETYDYGPLKGTPVYGSGETVDWDGIRQAIGPMKWKQILGDPQPVKAKLEALIEMKKVDTKVIELYVEEKPNKPYVKITRRTT